MQICSLYSGSKGNSMFLRLAGVPILVDAGKSARALCRSLSDIGQSIDDIRAIFLTHEHTDHVSALTNLVSKHPLPIHIAEGSLPRFPDADAPMVAACLKTHPLLYTEQIENLTVRSFKTSHDSLTSVGFRFEFEENGIKKCVGYATDVGYASDAVIEGLLGCEAVVLECNHDIEMLMEGPYPYVLKQRILSRKGHLSNPDCAALAVKLSENGTKHILLAHLSETNNTPDTAYDEVFGALAGSGVHVEIASPCEPTWLINEREETAC